MSSSLLVRLTLFALLLLAPLESASAQDPPPTAVIVADVLQQPLEQEISLVGTVQPRRSSLVASETEGRVVVRFRDIGQAVEAGEPLFRLENDALSASLLEAVADVRLHRFNQARSAELLRQNAVSEQILHEDEYQFARARAKLQSLENQVEDLTIRAPFTGHVVETASEIGEWVRRGDGVARVIATDTVRVHVDLPERHVDQLQEGDKADVVIDALGSAPRTGRITAILAEGRAASRTFPILVDVVNADGRIRSNMSAQVRFDVSSDAVALLVPKDALVNTPSGQVVFLAIDDQAVPRPVTPGLAYKGYIAVTGELQPGDLAIIRGNERLRDGQAVRIIRKHQ
ncbi:MAG: efflux RND transporter periplasmic adaptor subunit [Gemmatimonadetes bacterium]|nr:efflux RND transporter periplasmic adaptor subunit [Gemmatimonadota bacterium]